MNIYKAVKNNDLDTIKHLLNDGFQTDSIDTITSMTVLQYACVYGKFDIVKYLIETGADTNILSTHNLHSLHYANWNSNLEILKYLIENGADTKLLSKCDKCIFEQTLDHKDIDTLLYLFDLNILSDLETIGVIKYAIETNISISTIKLIINSGININTIYEPFTLLEYSIIYDNIQVMDLLFSYGAIIREKTHFCMNFCKNFLLFKCFINNGADCDYLYQMCINFRDKVDKSLELHGEYDIVNKYIKCGYVMEYLNTIRTFKNKLKQITLVEPLKNYYKYSSELHTLLLIIKTKQQTVLPKDIIQYKIIKHLFSHTCQ